MARFQQAVAEARASGRPRLDDAVLLERARAGNGIAFSALVERYLAPAVLVAEAVVGGGWRAEACAHAAFAGLGEAWPSLPDAAAYRRYLYRATLAAALATPPLGRAALRGRRRRGPSVAARVAWALHVHGELGYAQIAAVIGVSVARVRGLLAAARAAIGGQRSFWALS